MWLDTTGGPLVIEVPPRVLGMINDVWSRYVIDVGNAGPDKGQAANICCCRRLYGRCARRLLRRALPHLRQLAGGPRLRCEWRPAPDGREHEKNLRVYPLAARRIRSR